MNRKAYLAIAFGTWFGLTGYAAGQAPFPGAVNVNGGWVPCNHPIAIDAGKSCTGNPGYDYHPQPPQQPTHAFVVGQVLEQPYPSFRAVVISIVTDNGRTVVTARITRASTPQQVGDYTAFDAAYTQWTPLNINSLP